MVTFPNIADSSQDNTTQKPQKRKSTESSASPKTPKNQKKGNFLRHMNFYLTPSMYCLHARGFITAAGGQMVFTGRQKILD